MKRRRNRIFVAYTLAALLCLSLLMLLASCSFGSDTSANNQTPVKLTPLYPPTPTATPEPNISKTYTGDNYSVGYPADWNVSKQSGADAIASPILGSAFVINVTTADDKGVETHLNDSLNQTAAATKNFQKGETKTLILAGETWQQAAWSADENTRHVKGVTLIAQHNGKLFTILYEEPADKFSDVDAKYFQPMLQSFKFAS